jgi:tRNA-Thr(GGU) m(6)t(6)A37 methyltransferase TsaA
MSTTQHSQPPTYPVSPIGQVCRTGNGLHLQIDEPFRAGLKQLDRFSHVMVLWWADRFDSAEARGMLQTRPPYAKEHLTGVFATRAPYRPNPIAMTTCRLEGVNEEAGVVEIAEIDAFDGTPVVDLKAYYPVCDRVQQARIPEWLSDWPEWMPDEGIGLQEGEE